LKDTKPEENPSELPHIPWVTDRFFYGWVIVAVGMVGQFSQGISVQGFSSYLGPLQRDFGWNRALLAGPRSVTQVQNSVLGPIEGYLIDRFGPRKMVATGSFILGLGFILFGFTNSIWMYFLASMVIALGTGLQGLLILSVAVNNWFRRKRTIANSIMLLGFSMAGVFGVPLLVLIQSSVGWKESAIVSGLFVWAVGIPCSMLLRTNPELYGLLPDGDPQLNDDTGNNATNGIQDYDFTLKEALKTKAFWLIAVGSAIGNLGMGAAQTHLFLHLEIGLGLERSAAAMVWTVASVSNVPSRLIGGFLGDRFPKNIMLGFATISMSLSIFILGIATGIQMAFMYAFFYGIGWGIRTPVMNALQGEYFGRASQGIIRGWLQSVSIPFTIAAPVLAGYAADVQGNYRDTFMVTSVVMLIGAVLLLVASRPKPLL
jgi:MFS family permease